MSQDFLKEQERISLAEELMDLALMAKGTQKLFALINKECVFDLEKLQSKLNGLTKAERDALETKQLFDVVNDLTKKKKEADLLAAQQLEALRAAEAEQQRLRELMAAQGDEKDGEQTKLLEELQEMFDAEREQLMAENEEEKQKELEKARKAAEAEREKMRKEHEKLQAQLNSKFGSLGDKLGRAEAEKADLEAELEKRDDQLSRAETEMAELQSEMENREAKMNERLAEAEKRIKEAQKRASDAAKKREKELEDQIRKLQLSLDESAARLAELESSQSMAKLGEMEEKIGKLYWVNKELISQIRERDSQAKRLQGDYVSLQQEDQLKNLHIDTLDAKGREKEHQRDILLMTKKELEQTNARLDKLTEDHKHQLDKSQKELDVLKQVLDQKNCELEQMHSLAQNWKPKVEQLGEREMELMQVKNELQRVQLSFLKVKEELEKEGRRREVMSEEREREREKRQKNDSQLQLQLDTLKKQVEKTKRDHRSKEGKSTELFFALEARENEIKCLRSRINDLEIYLTKSIAINKQLERGTLDVRLSKSMME